MRAVATRAELASLTAKDLGRIAAVFRVKGRGRMNKAALVNAVRAAARTTRLSPRG